MLPVRLLRFLDGLCRADPSLSVCILPWDFHMVFAGEREWMQRVFFHWMTSPRFSGCRRGCCDVTLAVRR